LFELEFVSLPGKLIRFILLVASLAILIQHYSTIIGREAGSALLLYLICLKLLEMKTYRDEMVVLFLAYFLVVITFLYSQTIFTSIYLFCVLILLILTQVLLHHQLSKHQSWQWVIPHLKLVFKLIAHAAPLTLLLFILFPRIPGPLWGLPEDAFSAQTGLGDTMQPGTINKLSDNYAVSFRVKFSDTIPTNANLYWRGPVFWHFDGKSWSAPKQERRTTLKQSKINSFEQRTINYEITLEPHNKPWLISLDIPVDIPKTSKLSLEQLVTTQTKIQKLIRYKATSVLQPLSTNNTNWKQNARYLKVPNYTGIKTRELIASLKKNNPTDEQFISSVLDYFRTRPFYYSRTPPLLFDQPVDEFLFETRRGFCEHYASTFTVIMRLAGIPSRIVTGYQGGTLNPLSDYMIIRQSDAHAWSEVWLENRGWVRVDPTAVIPPGRIEYPADIIQRQPKTAAALKLLNQPWVYRAISQAGFAFDAINNKWNQWVVGYNQKKQSSLFKALGIPEIKWSGLATLLAVSTSITILFLSWRIYRKPKITQNPEVLIYNKYLKRLQKIGFTKSPGETPLQFSQRVSLQRNDLSYAINHITRLYQNIHYGKYPTTITLNQLLHKVNVFKPLKRKP
jgi:transglutaminase-like putative cysteine protease